MIPVKLGAKIPLFVTVTNEATDCVVKADLFTLDPYTVLQNDLSLTLVPSTPGYYKNETIAMPDKDRIFAVFSVFAADGVTLIAKAEELFVMDRLHLDSEELIAIIEDDTLVAELICD